MKDHTYPRRLLLALLACASVAALPTNAQAATSCSLAGDFSYTDNRTNSIWSYRMDDYANTPPAFLPLLTSTNLNAKMLWGPPFTNPPMMWSEGTGYWGIGKNTTGVAQTGSGVTWAPGEVLLHPKGKPGDGTHVFRFHGGRWRVRFRHGSRHWCHTPYLPFKAVAVHSAIRNPKWLCRRSLRSAPLRSRLGTGRCRSIPNPQLAFPRSPPPGGHLAFLIWHLAFGPASTRSPSGRG